MRSKRLGYVVKVLMLTLGLSAVSLAGTAATMLQIAVGVVHTFNPDHGGIPWAVTYDGKYYAVNEAAGAILPRLGWADSAVREELALAWVYKVELAGARPVDPAYLEPTPQQYHPPRVEQRDDGSVEVTLWTPLSSDSTRKGFAERLYRFDADGSLTRKVMQTELEEQPTWFWSRQGRRLTTPRLPH